MELLIKIPEWLLHAFAGLWLLHSLLGMGGLYYTRKLTNLKIKAQDDE